MVRSEREKQKREHAESKYVQPQSINVLQLSESRATRLNTGHPKQYETRRYLTSNSASMASSSPDGLPPGAAPAGAAPAPAFAPCSYKFLLKACDACSKAEIAALIESRSVPLAA